MRKEQAAKDEEMKDAPEEGEKPADVEEAS